MLRDHGGVKGAKPDSKGPGRKCPNSAVSISESATLRMQTKNLAAEMQLAERRGQLIEKRLVEQQAAYLLVALRQAILNIPQT